MVRASAPRVRKNSGALLLSSICTAQGQLKLVGHTHFDSHHATHTVQRRMPTRPSGSPS